MLEPGVAIGDALEVLHLRAGGEPSECETDTACILVGARQKRYCTACEANQGDIYIQSFVS